MKMEPRFESAKAVIKSPRHLWITKLTIRVYFLEIAKTRVKLFVTKKRKIRSRLKFWLKNVSIFPKAQQLCGILIILIKK